MNFDRATQLYSELRNEIADIEREAKVKSAELKTKMLALENWITLAADEQGLKNVPTPHGTAYWSVHNSASVASRDAFMDFVRDNEAWDLLEPRASKTAAKSFVEGHGEPPPGVTYSTVRVFNLRTTKE